jgi:PAS domain S-box-containing protein
MQSTRKSSILQHDETFFDLLTGSFFRLVGRSLIEPTWGAQWLYDDASFVVLSHNTDPDPIFVYANRAAQNRFGYDWQEFTSLPSRLSAEMQEREERQRLLETVARNGFIANYRGLRVTKSGHRFWMEDGIVWQLIDERGQHHGQAATFSVWTDIGR